MYRCFIPCYDVLLHGHTAFCPSIHQWVGICIFALWAVTNDTATRSEYTCVRARAAVSECARRGGAAGSAGSSYGELSGDTRPVFREAMSLPMSICGCEGSGFSASSLTVDFLTTAILVGVTWCPDSICISLTTDSTEHFFVCLWTIMYLEKCLFRSFAYCWLGCLITVL